MFGRAPGINFEREREREHREREIKAEKQKQSRVEKQTVEKTRARSVRLFFQEKDEFYFILRREFF